MDAAGNLGWDGANSFLYDAEGHICVAGAQSGWYGYLYDAEGNRVAKGTVTGWSCDTTTNGFAPTEWYVLGQNGEQVTAADGSGNWQHTNAYADGQLIGTYDQAGLHFQLSGWDGLLSLRFSVDPAVSR